MDQYIHRVGPFLPPEPRRAVMPALLAVMLSLPSVMLSLLTVMLSLLTVMLSLSKHDITHRMFALPHAALAAYAMPSLLSVMLSLSKHDITHRMFALPHAALAAYGRMLRQAQHDVSFDRLSMTLASTNSASRHRAAHGCMLRQAQHDVSFDKLSMTLASTKLGITTPGGTRLHASTGSA